MYFSLERRSGRDTAKRARGSTAWPTICAQLSGADDPDEESGIGSHVLMRKCVGRGNRSQHSRFQPRV